MAFRTRYRRKAPSSPELQGLFFKKAPFASAFFNPSPQIDDRSTATAATSVVQRQEGSVAPAKPEEEKPVQKQTKPEEEKPVQKQTKPEKEKPLQKQTKPEEEKPIQKQTKPEEEKPIQKQGNQNTPNTVKAKGSTHHPSDTCEEPQEPASLPNPLKAKVEALSGIPMGDVKVHYNSPKPAQVNALAYTQGTTIYLAPGQEKHLPHEVWHVVQQKQGRVAPTLQTKGVGVNDDPGLEQEATVMGQKANEQSSLKTPH